MRRRLFVHVGFAKCGSTSVQNLLAVRSRHLARSGIHVPVSGVGTPGRGHHRKLAFELGKRSRVSGNWERLADEINGSPQSRFVISSEFFGSRSRAPRCVERLQWLAAKEHLDITVVAYVRPQWQRLEAGYTQSVKARGRSETFDEFMAAKLTGRTANNLDYGLRLAPFRNAFGDQVKVFPMQAAQVQGGLVEHFQRVIGVNRPMRILADIGHANQRPGAKELEIFRLFNGACAGRQPFRKLRLLKMLIDEDLPFAPLRPEQINALRARFAGANQRFAQEYGFDPDGISLRDPPRSSGDCRDSVQWCDLAPKERLRVRRFVLDRTGVDLDPSNPPPPGGRWRVRIALLSGILKRSPRLLVRQRKIRSALGAWRFIME